MQTNKSISILTALLAASAVVVDVAEAGYYDYRPFINRVPILSKQRYGSSSLSLKSDLQLRLRSSPAILLSGGGQEIDNPTSGGDDNDNDNDDANAREQREEEEFLSYMEESDIMVEIRGGGGSIATMSREDNVNGSKSGDTPDADTGADADADAVLVGEFQYDVQSEGVSASQQPQQAQTQPQPTQPLRISTYRKGIRQLRNSERREERRLKRLERLQRREQRRQERMKLRSESYLEEEDGTTKSNHMKIAKQLKNRNNMNIRRKVLHASFGLLLSLCNQILPRNIFLPCMTVVTSSTLMIELLRYRKGFEWMNDALHFVLGGTLRKQEMEGKFTGSFYYFLGVTLTSYLFPQSCATLGICQLALADPSASYFGRQTRDVYWSRIENGFFGIGRNKGILGFLGGAAFCFPFNYYVLNMSKYGGSNVIPGGQSSVALASIALGVAGAFADLCVPTPALTMPKKIMGIPMPRFHVDDNVVVPIFSGYACTKIFEALGWTQGVDVKKFILF